MEVLAEEERRFIEDVASDIIQGVPRALEYTLSSPVPQATAIMNRVHTRAATCHPLPPSTPLTPIQQSDGVTHYVSMDLEAAVIQQMNTE